ncbi:MAG: hypothetical protein R3C10_24515 [Pirellulales bacterium]
MIALSAAIVVVIVAAPIIGLAAAPLLRWAAAVTLLFGLMLVAGALHGMLRPRIMRQGKVVRVATGPLRSVDLPLESVEGFLLGQGRVVLPLLGEQSARCHNLVMRLAERATDLQRGDVSPWLGEWADGYLTIRGTWCEPLDADLVTRLNAQLAGANRSGQE